MTVSNTAIVLSRIWNEAYQGTMSNWVEIKSFWGSPGTNDDNFLIDIQLWSKLKTFLIPERFRTDIKMWF